MISVITNKATPTHTSGISLTRFYPMKLLKLPAVSSCHWVSGSSFTLPLYVRDTEIIHTAFVREGQQPLHPGPSDG